MTAPTMRARLTPAATVLVVAARVALGALWLHEGYVKYHAGFGRADILLVVHSTAQNPRVPAAFGWFPAHVMGSVPGVFGVLVPLTETALGVAALTGVLPRTTALVATALLCSYWLSDQLIVQYPAMVALAAIVLAGGALAARWSVPALVATYRARGRAPSPSA